MLELTLKDYRKAPTLTQEILQLGDYSKLEVHNADLHTDRAYLFSKDLFPLALVEIQKQNDKLVYTLKDDVSSTDYLVPPLKKLKMEIDIAKSGYNSPIY